MINLLRLRHRRKVNKPVSPSDTVIEEPSSFSRRFIRAKPLFLTIVVLPTIISAIYFLFIASDIYISESKVIIRQADKKNGLSGFGEFLQSAGITNSREDVSTLKEFLSSRDVLRILEDNLALSKEFAKKNIDFVRRFNVFGFGDSFEDLFAYYQDRIVTIDVETTSSIFTIKVKAYTPQLARDINSALLFIGEGFVNELNERARNDLLGFSLQDVDAAENATRAAALALSEFRSRQTLFDPSQQSKIQFEQVAKLQDDLVGVRSQMAQLRTFTADSTYLKALEKRGSELQKEINSAMSKIAGGSDSIVQKMTEYERLTIERDFLEKRLVLALSSLEQTRSEAQRHRLYIATIAKPSLPDSTRYPERIMNIVLTFFGGLLVYGCLHILIIGTREHQA